MATSKLATVFGGSGFVGTQIVQALARRGYRVRVAVRRPDLAIHTRMHGTVGQIMPVQANLRFPDSVRRAVDGAHVVINLVGVGQSSRKQTFEAVHIIGAETVARAAQEAGAKALVHMSALGVDRVPNSAYARSKLEGESAVLTHYRHAVIMRPSIIFGPDDGFFNLMGSLARMMPIMPLIGAGAKVQPVYVGDVADAFVLAAEGAAKTGRDYELGGPEVVSQRELLERILAETKRNRRLVSLSPGMAKLLALPFSILPGPSLLTADKVELLCADNIVSPEAIRDKRTFAAFGITPVAMGTILPTYMWRFRKHGQFDRLGRETHAASPGTTE